MKLAAGLVLGVCVAAAQQAEPGGAKVFIAPQPIGETGDRAVKPFYYLTVLSPSGSEERVPASHVFPSRSKAYLNVLPRKQGHLVVFVGTSPDLGMQQFYDWSRGVAGDGDLVRDGENIKIPLSFDDKPGETRFTVALI